MNISAPEYLSHVWVSLLTWIWSPSLQQLHLQSMNFQTPLEPINNTKRQLTHPYINYSQLARHIIIYYFLYTTFLPMLPKYISETICVWWYNYSYVKRKLPSGPIHFKEENNTDQLQLQPKLLYIHAPLCTLPMTSLRNSYKREYSDYSIYVTLNLVLCLKLQKQLLFIYGGVL